MVTTVTKSRWAAWLTFLQWRIYYLSWVRSKTEVIWEISAYGFLGCPVLQAADIVLYQAHLVPVGIDPLPHDA